MNINGLLIGLITFLVIGLFHPLVIKAEYYWGRKSSWIFFAAGIAASVFSLLSENDTVSIIAGVIAFSSFWSVKEIYDQEKRVRKGWFPKNPKRKYDF